MIHPAKNPMEGGFSLERFAPSLDGEAGESLARELAAARIKYPSSDLDARIDGFAQEFGEALQALVKYKHGLGTLDHARLEVIQAIGQGVRLLEEAL